ncbi:hypothetical protein [Burkholderia phage vB_BglM_WTB]
MIDVTGFGTSILIAAIQTFPIGFELTQFADDVDPIQFENVETTGYEFLYDGTPFFFDKASVIRVTVSVVPGSEDDQNLKILLQARKGSQSIIPIPDTTTMTITYPDGGRVILATGSILTGAIADSVSTEGRRKGNSYTFAFGTFAGAQSATELIATVGQNLLSFL